jgi:hypothetical protein
VDTAGSAKVLNSKGNSTVDTAGSAKVLNSKVSNTVVRPTAEPAAALSSPIYRCLFFKCNVHADCKYFTVLACP